MTAGKWKRDCGHFFSSTLAQPGGKWQRLILFGKAE